MWLLPTVCCAALGLWQVSEPSLWIDEAFTARAISFDYQRLAGELHWAYYTLLKSWAHFAGTTELALRLPSVAAAVVAVYLTYAFARDLFDARVALIASSLLAINPFVVKWSQQARSYTGLVALAVASTWLLHRALRSGRSLTYVAYVVVSTTMVLWQFYSGLLVLAVHAYLARGSWRSLAALAPALVIAALRFRVMVESDRAQVEGVGTTATGSPLEWLPGPSLDDVGIALLSVPGALGLGLAVAVLGAVHAAEHRGFLLLWAFLPFGLSLGLSPLQPAFLDRYLIVACPAFAILGALALSRGLGRLRRPAIVCVAGATSIGLAVWYAPSGGDNWTGENWRAATALVMQESTGAEVEPQWAQPAFTCYGGRLQETGWVLFRGRRPDAEPSSPFGRWLWVDEPETETSRRSARFEGMLLTRTSGHLRVDGVRAITAFDPDATTGEGAGSQRSAVAV